MKRQIGLAAIILALGWIGEVQSQTLPEMMTVTAGMDTLAGTAMPNARGYTGRARTARDAMDRRYASPGYTNVGMGGPAYPYATGGPGRGLPGAPVMGPSGMTSMGIPSGMSFSRPGSPVPSGLGVASAVQALPARATNTVGHTAQDAPVNGFVPNLAAQEANQAFDAFRNRKFNAAVELYRMASEKQARYMEAHGRAVGWRNRILNDPEGMRDIVSEVLTEEPMTITVAMYFGWSRVAPPPE